jgi:hypothetical protein
VADLPTSSRYREDQTISSASRAVRRVVVTGSPGFTFLGAFPRYCPLRFCRRWEFHRYSLMQFPPSPAGGADLLTGALPLSYLATDLLGRTTRLCQIPTDPATRQGCGLL